jgi:DNA-binding CsgD family transcriptional regulator
MAERPNDPQLEDLTPREWQVFELLRRGFADHQIAQVLGIAEGEAGRYVSSVLSKLGVTPGQIPGLRTVTASPSPIPTPRPRLSGTLKFAAGALVILAVAAVAAIALAFVIDSDDRATAPVDEQASSRGDEPVPPFINDHWHAVYNIDICGEVQPSIPPFDGGIHTHGDGIIHLHPFTPEEEGEGARLVKFFEYAGGELTNDTLRMPGSRTTHVSGGTCPDGEVAFLRVIVNGTPLEDVTDYIPQDDDDILISLNPEPAATP